MFASDTIKSIIKIRLLPGTQTKTSFDLAARYMLVNKLCILGCALIKNNSTLYWYFCEILTRSWCVPKH